MLERNKENDELVLQHRELLKKAKDATNEDEKSKYMKLAAEKHDEMLMREFGDRNFKRFNTF